MARPGPGNKIIRWFFAGVILLALPLLPMLKASLCAFADDQKGWALWMAEEFSDDSYRKRWRTEGLAELTTGKAGAVRFLRIRTLENPGQREDKQSVLWFRRPVPGDLLFVFRVRAEAGNQSLFLFNANPTRESGFRTIFDRPRPDAQYVRYAGTESIEMYSLGMLRDRQRQCNIRYLGGSAVKTRSFQQGVHIPNLHAHGSPYFGKPDTWFELDLSIEGRRISLLVDGIQIAELEDAGESGELGTKWTPLTNGGYFGFRNFVPGRVEVDYIRVYRKSRRRN